MATALDWNVYQQAAYSYAIYEDNRYPALALIEECGELCGKFAKSIRGDKELDKKAALSEIGDILWNIAAIHTESALPFPNRHSETLGFELGDMDTVDIVYVAVGELFRYRDATGLQALDAVAKRLGSSSEECAFHNLAKLQDRKERDEIRGEGDER